MMSSKEKLLAIENVKTYFNGLEKRFMGEPLSPGERELVKEINIAVEYDPDLEGQLLNVFLEPVASTYSGLKLLFSEKEAGDRGEDAGGYPAAHYTEMEWRLIRKAAASEGRLYNTLRDRIDHIGLGRIEEGKDKRKFFMVMPLAADITLYLEVVRMGTQWLVIPVASCAVIYIPGDGDEKMQTKFKSLRLKLGDLKDKGVFVADGRIVIKR